MQALPKPLTGYKASPESHYLERVVKAASCPSDFRTSLPASALPTWLPKSACGGFSLLASAQRNACHANILEHRILTLHVSSTQKSQPAQPLKLQGIGPASLRIILPTVTNHPRRAQYRIVSGEGAAFRNVLLRFSQHPSVQASFGPSIVAHDFFRTSIAQRPAGRQNAFHCHQSMANRGHGSSLFAFTYGLENAKPKCPPISALPFLRVIALAYKPIWRWPRRSREKPLDHKGRSSNVGLCASGFQPFLVAFGCC